jgi:hypothetical protein
MSCDLDDGLVLLRYTGQVADGMLLSLLTAARPQHASVVTARRLGVQTYIPQ